MSESVTITATHIFASIGCLTALLAVGILFYTARRKYLDRRESWQRQSRDEARNEKRDELRHEEERRKEDKQQQQQVSELGEWYGFYRQLEQVEGCSLRFAFLKKVIAAVTHDDRSVRRSNVQALPKLSMAGLSYFLKLFYSYNQEDAKFKPAAAETLTAFVDFEFPKTETECQTPVDDGNWCDRVGRGPQGSIK